MKALMLAAVLALAGCASLQTAGVAEYAVRPVIVNDQVVCCEVTVKNGKEIALIKAHIEKTGDNYTVDLEERGVVAFQGQSIAAGAVRSGVDSAASLGTAALGIGALGTGLRVVLP